MKLLLVTAFVIASASAQLHGPPHAPPPPPPPPPKGPHHGYHDHGPAKYQYGYAVHDDYHGTNFGANEARDGYATHGEYHVALPDGRIQTVTYHVADAYSGYVADVKYSGEPHPYQPPKPHGPPAPYHPPPKPVHPAPHPHPAPYKPIHH